MSRIAAAFASAQAGAASAQANADATPLLIPYLTAGFPTRAESVPLFKALVAGGASVIEIGVPFSDPLADGPTIQRANSVALAQGVGLSDVLETMRTLRRDGVTLPILLMGYLNPFLAYGRAGTQSGTDGYERLARDLADAGADGLIIVDLPVEESGACRAALDAAGLDLIFMLAPTSTEERIRAVAERASGFIYLVSVTGVTGARTDLPADLTDFVQRVRRHTALPLAVGFGISSRTQVESVGKLCEAAVVGSAIVQAVEAAPPSQRIRTVRRLAEELTGRRGGDRK